MVEDRLCGYGPPLSFYIQEDQGLAEERSTVFKYLDLNYEAADKYIKRFEPLREFYAEDCEMYYELISNERG